jgi:hypothetical protein
MGVAPREEAARVGEHLVIHQHRFPAPHVLRVSAEPEGKLGVPFLNWRVAGRAARERGTRTAFAGCGLYGVCFRGRLVYVGSYCGQRPGGTRHGAHFTGDVVKQRWWAHFGSLTARGHKLHVARRVLASLSAAHAQHPLVHGLQLAGADIHTDAGCLGAENRLRFAVLNWARFSSTTPTHLLEQFSFLYARDDGANLDIDPDELERLIEDAETDAIAAMQPEVNTALRSRGSVPARLSPRKALGELARILDLHLQPHRTGQT